MSETPKPCPWCGGKAIRTREGVMCADCCAYGPPTLISAPETMWNRRTPPPTTAAFLAAFRRACPSYLSDNADVDIIFKACDIRRLLAEWPREEQ